MLKNFKSFLSGRDVGQRSDARRWLQIGAGVLAALNIVVFYVYLDPPGGTQRELTRESDQLRSEIAAMKGRALRLKAVSEKVQTGSAEATDFETKYVLPKRLAYGSVIAEIERMAKAAGLEERDAVYNEEPIEGSADLNLMSSTANYSGSYQNLKRFLYEVDHSPMLIMLENITAAPQQQGNQINTSIRFQAVIRDDGADASKGRP